MPKGFLMDQISRPFQIALVAVGLLAAVWLFALQGHSASTPESSGSAPSTTAATPPSAAAQEKAAAAPTPVYKGAAPGVAGLTSAIAKAHGAVATSQQNAKELERKSAQASTTGAPAASSAVAATPATKAAAPAAKAHAPSTKTSTTVVKVTHGAPAGQKAVEADLAAGNVEVLLFWTPAGSDDKAVHAELRALLAVHNKLRSQQSNPTVKKLESLTGLQFAGKIAVHEASAGQVTNFGSITRGVQVTGTPTLLIINKHGRTITLTGLQDAYAIEQAIDEARSS
jgi:hypothetical protein